MLPETDSVRAADSLGEGLPRRVRAPSVAHRSGQPQHHPGGQDLHAALATPTGLGRATTRLQTGRGFTDNFVPDLFDGPRLAPARLRLPGVPQTLELLARGRRQSAGRRHGALPPRCRSDRVHLHPEPAHGLAVRRSSAHRDQRQPRAVDPRRLRCVGPSLSTPWPRDWQGVASLPGPPSVAPTRCCSIWASSTARRLLAAAQSVRPIASLTSTPPSSRHSWPIWSARPGRVNPRP